jgi:hypothetical protein
MIFLSKGLSEMMENPNQIPKLLHTNKMNSMKEIVSVEII